MMKRIISFLLALVICLNCLPDVRLQVRANDDEIPAATEAPETPTAVPTETSAPQVVSADWTPPYKNEYIVNREKLDTTGCTLTLTYDDGTQEVYDITPDMVTGFDNTVLGYQTLIAGCQGYQLYFDVVIIDEPKPQHIYFNGWQIKNAYPQGAPLDLTDGVVEVFYDNGSQESVPATDPSVTVSGYDPNLLGTQILTVSYMGLTAEFEVTVYTLSGQCGDDLQYSFDEATGTLTITGSGAMDDFDWNTIPWRGFADQILTLELPDTLTALGAYAFRGCVNLTSVNLPDGITEIPDSAFEECHALTAMTIPDTVKRIGIYSFSGAGLYSITLPEGLETIDMYAFMSAFNLESVDLPESLKTLGGGAFQYCGNLETAELPETLDMISWQVFNECNSLQDILIPKSVTEISYFAFNSCTAMQDVVFEGSAPTVDAGMTGDMYPFKNVTSEAWYPAGDATWTPAAMAAMGGNLTWMNGESMPSGTCGENLTWWLDASNTLHISGTGEMEGYSHYSAPWNGNTVYRVVVHPGVTAIGTYAFSGMEEIVEVQLPDSLLSIGSESFRECGALKKITFPDSLEEISWLAFASCTGLESIVIPDSLEEISWLAFAGCTGLESIVIPGTVNVGDEAFANCTGLTEVILGDGFTHLSNEVFSNCASLKTVILPEGLKTIGTGTFTACPALTEITIPSTVTEIHSSAFGRNRLEKSVTIDPEKTITFTGDAPEMEDGAFSGSVIIAQYPFGNLTWTADKMQDYGGTVTWVPTGSVAGTCGKNLSWTLENGVLTIAGTGEMFGFPEDDPAPWSAYHTFIEKVVVESGVTTIGSHAFDGTACPGYAGITELELPDTLVSIGEGAFNTCLGLTSICIPGSVTKIGGGAFASCENLETVVLSEGLQIIGDAAFDFCSALKEITVPSTVTIVGEYAFSGETGAEKTIHFTGNAPKFNENAFYEIVASVYYPADDATWTAEKMQNYGGTVTWIPDSGCVLSGTCGDSLIWEFDEVTGILTISGEGSAIYNYSESDPAPWNKYTADIKQIEFSDNIGYIGSYAFANCTALTAVVLPHGDGSVYLERAAFSGCTNLKEITFQSGITHPVFADTFEGVVANVYFPAGYGWSESSQKQFGDQLIWIEYGEEAVKLTLGLSFVRVGETASGTVEAHPAKATADCAFEVADPEILEIISSDQKSVTYRGLKEGRTTVTATDQNTGLSVSTEVVVYDSSVITLPYTERVMMDRAPFVRSYTVTPMETANYVLMMTDVNAPGWDSTGFSATCDGEYVPVLSWYWGEGVIRQILKLTAGKTYEIQASSAHPEQGVTAVIEFRKAETEIDEIDIIQDVIELEVSENNWCWVNAVVRPLDSYSDIQWSIGNTDIAEIQNASGNECSFQAKKAGTTELVVTCNGKTDTARIIVYDAQILKLDETLTLEYFGGSSYCARTVMFTPDEAGRYVFTVRGNGRRTPDISYNSARGEVYYGYGEDYRTLSVELAAKETFAVQISGHTFDGNQSITVTKATDTVTGMRVVCTHNTPERVEFGVQFTPATAAENVVKWEVSNPNLLGQSLGDDIYHYNNAWYTPYGTGKVTVTAISESGLTASYTMTVGECLNGHDYSEFVPMRDGVGTPTGDEYRTCSRCDTLESRKVRPIQTVTSGICGDTLTWKFDEETGTLTIAGSGAMYNYTWDGAPWKPYAEQILAVELPDTLTALGAYAFDGCVNLRQIQLPEGIPAIPAYAFNKCMSLTSLTIPDSVRVIGDTALSECNSLTSLVLPDGVETVENFAFSWNSGLKEIVLPKTLQNLNCGVFDNCTALESVNIPESLETINWATFNGCTSLKEITIPASVTEIVYSAFGGCTGLEDVIFEGSAPYVESHVFEPFGGVTANAWYSAADDTWTEDIMVRLGRELSWFPNGPVKNSIMMDAADFGYAESVWIDGREYLVEYKRNIGMIDLPDSNAKTMVAYTYHEGNPDDVHTRYPVSMKVWTLTNEDGYYTVHRQQQLDDLLQYSGMSIRVYGKKGIRMITSIEQAKKNALTGAGLAGFTLKEYGTVLAWADQISDNKPLVLGKYYAKSNYAYRKGIADPVFNVTGSLMQYTNVLVNFSDAQCRDDIAMRPYIILEDESGQQITLYGGIVQRSIGYIAYQNRNVFEPGTDEYEYVWSIIRYVYGTLYDDEYIVAWTPPAM